VFRFFQGLIALRKAHPLLGHDRFWRERVSWCGVGQTPDLSSDSHALAFCLHWRCAERRPDVDRAGAGSVAALALGASRRLLVARKGRRGDSSLAARGVESRGACTGSCLPNTPLRARTLVSPCREGEGRTSGEGVSGVIDQCEFLALMAKGVMTI
jgi:hypothetical protein